MVGIPDVRVVSIVSVDSTGTVVSNVLVVWKLIVREMKSVFVSVVVAGIEAVTYDVKIVSELARDVRTEVRMLSDVMTVSDVSTEVLPAIVCVVVTGMVVAKVLVKIEVRNTISVELAMFVTVVVAGRLLIKYDVSTEVKMLSEVRTVSDMTIEVLPETVCVVVTGIVVVIAAVEYNVEVKEIISVKLKISVELTSDNPVTVVGTVATTVDSRIEIDVVGTMLVERTKSVSVRVSSRVSVLVVPWRVRVVLEVSVVA